MPVRSRAKAKAPAGRHVAENGNGIRFVRGEEARRIFNRIAKRHLGMTGREFLRRWDAGEWKQVKLDSVPGLVDVWMAMPFAR